MRSHPAQVSFPGGSVDPGETAVEAALRESQEETGLDPEGVEVFAELPELWLPPSNFAVTPVLAWWHDPSRGHGSSTRTRCTPIYRVPLAELIDPVHRISVRHPSGWVGPASSSATTRTSSCGASPPASSRGSSTSSGGRVPWDEGQMRDLPAHVLSGPARAARRSPSTTPGRAGEPARLAPGAPGLRLRPVGLLAGLRHRGLRHSRTAARRSLRHLAGTERPRRRRPLDVGLPRRALRRDLVAPPWVRRSSSTPARGCATASPGSRSAPWTPWVARCSARSRCCWSPGRWGSRSPAPGWAGSPSRSAARPSWPGWTETLPQQADQMLQSFDDVVGASFFPRYLEPFAPERIVQVGPGPKRLLQDPDVLGAGPQRAQGPRLQPLRPGSGGVRASCSAPVG